MQRLKRFVDTAIDGTDSVKGQLISEWNFGVFKSPKKPTKFYKNLISFLGDLKAPENFILRLIDL